MKLVLLGGPGAGKGTQAVMIAKKYDIPHISTGDIFRSNIKNGTTLGIKVKEYLDSGALVPDSLTVEIVRDRLSQSDCGNGFVLDGFPRTIPQAEYLETALEDMCTSLDMVVNIAVPDDMIVKRISGRRVCAACNAGYHIVSSPSSKPGICDTCGAELIQRVDDKEETVLNRLETYHRQTEPLIKFYEEKGKLKTVSGEGTIDDTFVQVKALLDSFGNNL
jgi:adenylate kinase